MGTDKPFLVVISVLARRTDLPPVLPVAFSLVAEFGSPNRWSFAPFFEVTLRTIPRC
jgi:hypothetical protein